MENVSFVEEQMIENAIDTINNFSEKEQTSYIENLSEIQSVLVSYVLTDKSTLLIPSEKQLLWFMFLVIWESVQSTRIEVPFIDADSIGIAEEENWTNIELTKGDFREKLNIFFEKYPQEDLLAFVEDLLIEPDTNLTQEGQFIIFITAKTIIDVIIETT